MSMTQGQRFGHNGFVARVRERTGREPYRAQVRLLEALDVIHPEVSDSGWRMFDDHDVAAAAAWLNAQRGRASA
jgi:hypothetical protein